MRATPSSFVAKLGIVPAILLLHMNVAGRGTDAMWGWLGDRIAASGIHPVDSPTYQPARLLIHDPSQGSLHSASFPLSAFTCNPGVDRWPFLPKCKCKFWNFSFSLLSLQIIIFRTYTLYTLSIHSAASSPTFVVRLSVMPPALNLESYIGLIINRDFAMSDS
jgi:hypothetical protein